ncbi:MAG: YcxB family protein [Terrimonas sp.]|nr:YcxB family protein [Terrimonas sp.]
MTISFHYDKRKVIQALRYHFISRPELKIMIILVNVFAFTAAALFYFQKVTSLAFLMGSFLWFFFMMSIWFLLPGIVYRRAATFRDHFTMQFEEDNFTLGNERGSRSWPWKSLQKYLESPHFFHLYFDSRSFFLVPKEGCKDDEEVYTLRKLLKEKIRK